MRKYPPPLCWLRIFTPRIASVNKAVSIWLPPENVVFFLKGRIQNAKKRLSRFSVQDTWNCVFRVSLPRSKVPLKEIRSGCHLLNYFSNRRTVYSLYRSYHVSSYRFCTDLLRAKLTVKKHQLYLRANTWGRIRNRFGGAEAKYPPNEENEKKTKKQARCLQSTHFDAVFIYL